MKLLAALALSAGLLGAGCGEDGNAPPPSAGVVTLVLGPVSSYGPIVASGPSGSVELTAELREAVVPLRAARAFAPVQPLLEYGLEQPQGGLRYERVGGGEAIDLAFGGLTFDGRGIYVSRRGDGRVLLVFVDRIRPVLTAVGIELPDAREPAGT